MIRHSVKEDIPSIMHIINQAKAYFLSQGIDQWQDGYPNEEELLNDIKLNNSYVIDDHGIIGTMFFSFDGESDYNTIDGKWLTDTPYGVIHRIAVDENIKGKGTAYLLLEYAIKECRLKGIDSIRIDTHDDNLSMQAFLKKHGFIPCGHITLKSGALRIAFEKIIE